MTPKPLSLKQRIKVRRLQRPPRMTIALGFLCIDGLVLCTDSLETDGVTKRLVKKIWTYQVGDEWGISIASAGEADLADSFTDGLKDVLGNESFDEGSLLAKLRVALSQIRRTYPRSELGMLIGVFGPLGRRRLFRVVDGSEHLGPVKEYEALGTGAALAKFLCSQMKLPFAKVDEAVLLATFIVSRCNEHIEGCGGPVSLVASENRRNGWLFYHPEQVTKIEGRFPASGFRDHLIDYWISKTTDLQRFGHVIRREAETGGFPEIITKDLKAAKPSGSRKSKRGQ